MRAAAATLALLCATAARADEGLWPFERVPAERLRAAHGFAPGAAWLDEARLAAVKLPGCSGGFVSPLGLIATNHHCVHRCLAALSANGRDLAEHGFYAPEADAERKCPGMEALQLVAVEDATDRLRAAAGSLEGAERRKAERRARAELERSCPKAPGERCAVVSLWHGARAHLYRYRFFSDVRLVFAPELAAAFFGGDPDNFAWPRHDLDAAFLRAYDGGEPAKTSHYFRWSRAPAKAGALVFVAGHPGRTERQRSAAELETERDASLPQRLLEASELRGEYAELMREKPDERPRIEPALFQLENSLKALRGRWERLRQGDLIASRRAGEARLAAPAKAALARVEEAERRSRALIKSFHALDSSPALRDGLLGVALQLARYAELGGQKSASRPRSLRDEALPALAERLAAPAERSPALELIRLRLALRSLRELLPATSAELRALLDRESPEALAARLLQSTALFDARERQRLFAGGPAAIDASADALLDFARKLRSASRSLRASWEAAQAQAREASTELARLRFESGPLDEAPDATATLRLSVGVVEPPAGARAFTTFGEAFARATGRDPYRLPQSWLDAKPELNAGAPLNFVCTADLAGGSSGSPVLSADRTLVGLLFDGNAESLGDSYAFDPASRAIAVDAAAVLHVLDSVYRAGRLSAELQQTPAPPVTP